MNLVACKLHLDKAVFTKGAVSGTLEVHRRELLDLVQLRLINAKTQAQTTSNSKSGSPFTIITISSLAENDFALSNVIVIIKQFL